jgi:hypothetical protein
MEYRDKAVLARITELTGSYVLQCSLYNKLSDCVQKMYGQLVLSRGNLSGVMGMLKEKQMLIQAISAERDRVRSKAEIWQTEKSSVPQSVESERLNEVLTRTESAIKAFLDIESQLEKYLLRLTEQESRPAG